MDLEPGEKIIFEGHPSWRSMLVFYIKGTGIAVALAVLTALVYQIAKGDPEWTRASTVLAVVFGITLVVGYLRRWATIYTISSERLRIKRGIVARKVQQTRIMRVQNVNHEQGVLDRFLNIGKVDFDTAGTDDSDFTFNGVADPEGVIQAVSEAEAAHQSLHADELGTPQSGPRGAGGPLP